MNAKVMKVLVAVVVLSLSAQVFGQVEARVELLWPNGAPQAKGDADGDRPSITIYLPPKEKATGAAVVICPGGGYGHLAIDHEGHQIARWLNSFGVAGFILKYRHRNSGAGYGHPVPLMDAQRAISMVRARAAEFEVDPARIGILGFSAGGHLASTAATHFHTGRTDTADAIDRVSCRPDFAVLVYPVISLTEWFTHVGSRTNLLGRDGDAELIRQLSNELHVTPQTPPTFLLHTNEDTAVPAENSVYFYLALRKAKVPAELHIYEKGQHGVGLGAAAGAVGTWPRRCEEWMRGRGLLEKAQR
ncbi:MAG TPA: alpha/beta hydrolase [Anaerohalosphaeraceae bacterium]|jgi:acetyl esterase/lipase|nr:alpha/beta hydrolase [Anaerohalosphaeraceae bacterium]HRT48857.1 alpha/beta hydrolase [Anaerohalosphaeraceae bacterium]HRT84980.1 alpha/beta hydrolase [Anaerohalosphaeraceae bacterium]